MKLPRFPARSAVVIALVAIALVLSWLLGANHARKLARDGAATQLANENTASEQLIQVTRERDIAIAAEQSLKQRLSEATRLDADERAELELYRRISSASTPIGLSIDGVRLRKATADQAATLDVTLVQSRGRDRVEGTVTISLLKDGEVLADATSAAGGEPLEFDLRFFQTVSQPLNLSEIDGVDVLRIAVEPDGELHKPFTEDLAWEPFTE